MRVEGAIYIVRAGWGEGEGPPSAHTRTAIPSLIQWPVGISVPGYGKAEVLPENS